MDASKLERGEIVAIIGGLVLAIAVFLTWYHVTGNGHIDEHGVGSYSAWDVHPIMRILLLLGAIAPLVLGWIVIRDHALSWPRGEMTSIVAIIAIGLLFYTGIIDKPGDPRSEIHLRLGWFLAFLGAIAMLVGSVMRQQESGRARRPPGTL
jgi:hypothetical protein